MAERLTSVQQVAVARTLAVEYSRRRLYEALNNGYGKPYLDKLLYVIAQAI